MAVNRLSVSKAQKLRFKNKKKKKEKRGVQTEVFKRND